MKPTKVLSFIFCLFLFFNCEQETVYQYEAVKAEIEPFLQPKLADVFQDSDTLILYDTTYFNHAITTLSEYKNHLEAKDSVYNNLIINRLQEIEINKKKPEIIEPNI